MSLGTIIVVSGVVLALAGSAAAGGFSSRNFDKGLAALEGASGPGDLVGAASIGAAGDQGAAFGLGLGISIEAGTVEGVAVVGQGACPDAGGVPACMSFDSRSVPAPGALGVLGLGGVMMRRGRR